jgi:mannitol/fructose-specific phosphotransferase system IIA component (Ntr-type)
MNLSTLLVPERVNLELRSRKKPDVLRELVEMVRSGPDVDLLLSTLLKREELGSTGIGKGIAIPHCRSLVIDRLELAVGRSTKGVTFKAVDRKPVHLLFLIMAPPQDPGNQYLITLGRVALVAQELIKGNRIFEAKTPSDFIQLIRALEERVK